jgi:hypothetical protein
MARHVGALLLAAGLLMPMAGGAGSDAGPSIFGLWREPAWGAEVRLYPCAGALCGRLVRLPEDAPGNDRNNPDPAKQARGLVGLTVIHGFRRGDAAGRTWIGGGRQGGLPGRIYVPANGDTLGDAENAYAIRLEDADRLTIGIHGCVFSCFAKSTWTRVRD